MAQLSIAQGRRGSCSMSQCRVVQCKAARQHSKAAPSCSCRDAVSADCQHRCPGHRPGSDCLLCACTEADEQAQAKTHQYRANLHTSGKYGIARHVGPSRQHDCSTSAVLVHWWHRLTRSGMVLRETLVLTSQVVRCNIAAVKVIHRQLSWPELVKVVLVSVSFRLGKATFAKGR